MTGRPRPTGVIAMLFTDIEGSTRLARLLGDEWPRVLATHREIVGGAIAAADGFVDGTEGDSFFATFEDTAAAAVAATTAQRGLRAHTWPLSMADLRVRMGIHTGEVLADEHGYVGLEIHRAARVGAAAHGGQVLTTAAVRRSLPSLAVEDLGLHRLKDFPEPERLFHLVIDADRPASWFPPPRGLDARPTNLPPTDRELMGRDGVVADVVSAFAAGQRVVTITGPGGIGKTSVALAVARSMLTRCPGGVWLVEAARLGSADELRAEVTTSVRVPHFEALADRFDGLPVLLVLDNLEQVQSAADVAAALIVAVPTMQVLATSRVPLRLRGERIVTLTPLGGGHAIELLAEIVHTRGGSLDPADPAAAELCSRLEGLPLALELMAPQLRVLSPAEVLARLRSFVDVRSTEVDRSHRHQSLRQTVQWSLDLVPPEALDLFTRLAVFSGPVPLDIIEEVLEGSEADLLGSIGTLVDHSLLTRGTTGLRMLAPVREIAVEKFSMLPDAADVRRRHAAVMLSLARRSGDRSDVEIDRYGAEDVGADVWAATLWAHDHDEALHRALVLAAGPLWRFDGRSAAGLREVAVAVGTTEPGSQTWAQLLLVRSSLHLSVGTLGEAVDDVERALAALTRRSPSERANDLLYAVFAYQSAGQRDRAAATAEAAVEAARASGRTALLASTLLNLAQSYLALGRYAEADLVLDEVEELAASRPDIAAAVDCYRGDWYLATGEPARALVVLERACRGSPVEPYEPWWISGIAQALGALGEPAAALEVGAAALASAQEHGLHVAALTQVGEPFESAMARWRATVGATAAAVESSGRMRTVGERLDWALQVARRHVRSH